MITVELREIINADIFKSSGSKGAEAFYALR